MDDIGPGHELKLSILNPRPLRVPGPRLLHQLVHVTSDEAIPAIHSLDGQGKESTWSYSQLHLAADVLAKRITAAAGILSRSTEFVVPLLVPQCPQLYISMLAILKAGGAFCPLHIDAPPERVSFILQDVAAKVVVVSRGLVSKVSKDGGDRVILVVDEDAAPEAVTQPYVAERISESDVTSQRLAYVMYTSGSTGTPKGVGVSHDAATQSLLAHNRHVPAFNRFLQFASPTFDVSVFEIFFPFFRGCTLVICDRGRMLDDLPTIIQRLQVDACELTPTVAGSLLRSRQNAPCLRLLLTIGEMLTESVVKEFGGDQEVESMLWGMYGPTEAAIHCTLQPRYQTASPSSNIGFPLDSVSCFVAAIPDEGTPYTFEVLPVGEVGELVVGGHQLASGYLNRPEQTGAAFIQTSYGRAYRTGDKARINSDGTMDCLGRISEGQIKLRGQRIELGEVEQAAMRTSGCHSAVAMVLGGLLIAFCAVDDDNDPASATQDIISVCRAWLPSFMVPGDVILRKIFPRLPSGKIDRKQIRAEYEAAKDIVPGCVSESNDPLEREVLRILSELGGESFAPSICLSSAIDSLLTIRLASTLRERGFRVSAADVLESKNIVALCARIRATETNAETQGPPIRYSEISLEQVLEQVQGGAPVQEGIESCQSCTPLQNAMLTETSVNSRAYCNWIRLQFPANSSAHDVRKWIFEVANANQILRSAFVPFAHGYAQVVPKRLAERHVQIVKEFAYDFAMISDEDYSSPFRVQVQDNPGNDGTLALLQIHHALYDGWTADLLLEDLSTLAAGHFLEERPQFYEVADFFHGPAVTMQMDEARSFWADQLLGWQRHGLPRLMGRLPDKVEVQTAAKTMNISQAGLDDVAKSFQCHAQVFFQAAILWLWAGLQGQTDVVIGSVSSGRTIPVTNIERIMGPCISTTPLRVNLKELTSISDLVRFIHSTNRRVLQHGILPLGEVKKLSGLGPGDAMFDILFVYQESLYSNAARHGKVREVAHRDFLETNILVEIEPTANGPHCCLTYHTNALSDAHANLILDQLESVVRYLLDNPGNPIDAIQAELTPDLTSTFNANPRELATTPDLAAIFEQTTERTPDAVAICFATSPENDEYDTMSYHDLNSMANQIACYLRNQGARQGGIIGLIMEKSLPLYAAMLGILKAGCAYLPLLPSVPKERIHSILLQADVGLCVADAEVSLKLPNLPSCRFVDVRSHSVNLLAMPSGNISLPPDPSRPAYVIYTSGTTGTPKGVVVTQLNIAGNLDVLSRIYPISHHSRFLQACSQAFDVSVFEIFFTWKVGACLCSGTNDTLFEDLERAIRKLGCTHLSMTPTVASLVDPRNVPNVEFLVTAGEPMTAVVAKNWTGLLFQGYGPAETTNICTVKKMKPGDVIDHLGFSFENTSTFVLAPGRSEALPVGFVGELCFGGDQVAAGYLGMQGLTDSKFINHPQFGRIYRSGDMGRMLPDGSLMVLGRMDDQLKLRGQRIDTGEISSTLTTSGLATSSEAVIVNRENSPATHLAVFYVPANRTRAEYSTLLIDENLSEANNLLMGQLRAKLPTYMVPTYLIPITSVPLTASGKIDRSRLKSSFRALDQDYLNLAAGSSSQHNDEHVWSEQEKEVASALSQVLAVPPEAISRWQPFAAVGLDSISAISLARSLRNTFARRIPVSLILESGSVARLAQQVASQSPDPDSTRSASTVSFFAKEFVDNLRKEFASKGKVVSAVLPCTPLQEAMVSSTAGSSYCNQLLFKLRVPSTEMRAYWEEMSRRHGILRTSFVTTREPDHAVAQVVLESWTLPWHTMEAENLLDAVERHAKQLPVSLDSLIPPVSLAIIRSGHDEYLSFVCHHALYDGVAIDALLSEVEALALGSSLPAPVDYLPVLREMINPQDGRDAFWRRSFEGFRPIPHKLVAKGVVGKVSEKPVVMAEPLKLSLGQLQSVCKASGVSTLSFFQATWTVFLSLLYEETDVCFGNVMSGRSLDHEGIDRLVAPCFNTVPVRVEMASSTQAVTLLKTLQGLNPHLLHHQFTPLRHVQAQVAKRGIQLFDSLLLVQQPRTERSSRVWDLLGDNGIMDIPLVCEIIPDTRADTVLFKLHSNSEYMTPDALAGLLQLVLQLAVDIAQFPASTIPSRASLSAGLAQSLSGVVVERHADAGERASHDVSVVEEEIWTALEDQIRQIVAKLAKTSVHKIGRDTTIFQLGLDSINAVQLAAMMRDEGLQLSALEVLEFLTCAEMAGHLSRSSGTGSVANYDFAQFERDVRGTTRVGDAEKILPCTPLQCAMLNDFIQSKGTDYLNYVSFDIDEGITMAQLQTAWISLVSHHEILRTGFLPTQHQDASFAMLQHPFANLAVPLTIHDDILNPFNVFKWKLDAAQHVLQSLHLPPWTLALERSGSVIRMHFVVHHALYDAHSLQLLLRDLSTYLVESREPTRRGSVEMALSKILLASVDNHESRQFWTEKSSEVVVNRFPTMTPLSEKSPGLVSTSKPSVNHLDDLSKSAKDAGFSIQVYLEAAWTRVLSSYIGEDDVVFGVVLSGRLDKDTKDAPFPCINTVPVVAHNRSSNSELLEQIFNNHKQLLKHQHAPLAQVQGWLGYPNTPLFDTLLVYQRFPDNEGVDFPWKPVSDEGNLDYPVSLELEPLKDGHLQLRLTHRTDVLPTAQAGHLLDQFDAVLRQLSQSPTGKEDELWLKNASKFSITSPLEPNIASEEHFLHQLVETKARTHPAKTALEFVTGFNGETPISRKWTFKELNDKGNQVANLLHPLAKVGHVIAIHFDKCPEACFSILGILKSGCAFLALDPSAPKARKEFIMKDSGALVLLTNDTIDFDIDQPVIHIDEPSLNGNPKQYTTPEALNVQHNSYCLYTSGTTGTPKGCEITHENAVQAMKAFQRLFAGHWDHTSKWLQFASFHFDVSVLEQYWTWSVGMTLVGAPRDLILDDLAGAIRRLEITHIDLTPSLARLLDPAEVPSLSRGVFITGGEALKQEILDVWGPVGVIYNAYGPTEATIGVTMYQRVPHNGRASNIGKQFDNVGSYVLRPGTDIPVLRGGVGELCVSGKLVGKGYLNRPELTEERFPYLKSFGERVYRTGDLVRLLHDGCFDFLGRADDQVKLRGQRLELGEINHAIRTRVPEITDVATLVTKHGSLDKDLLVSFISCKSTVTSTAALKVLYDTETAVLARAVQKACRDTLPGYMVPSYVFQVPRIPLSPNNKADFKQLNQLFRTLTPERLVQLSPSTRTTSEPSTEIQRRTLSAVQEFVGADTVVSLSSNIFDLGMDSISALRLSRLMRKNGLLGAAPRVVLRNPVLADLAEALQQSQSLEEGTGAYEARQLIQAFGHRYRSLATQELSLPNDREIEYVAPCTPLQEGMLSRFMSDQDEGAYFTAFRLKLSPSVSIDKLKAACERLVQCHPILRTRFIQTPAGFAQIALRSGQLSWKDLRTTSSSDVEAELSRSLPCLIHRNNKCVSDPLELIVAQLEGETILVVHIFHALYDGTSFETMLRWVSREYLQQEHEAAPSFLDTLAHGPLANYDTSRQFWAEHLRHCSFDTIQRLPHGDHATVLAKTKTYSARNLETLRRSLNVTLQSVVLALWTSGFKKHFPINAATGVIVSGRSLDIDQIENTIGPLFNTLLFYAGIKDGDTWLSLIQKCHEFNTAVLQFQHVPLRNIQKWCARSRGRPIFENLFVFQVDSAKVTEPTTMWSIMDDYSVSDYPLAFEASVTSDGQLRVQIVAHGDVADEATMDSLFEDIDEAMVDVTSRGTHSLPVTENPSREASAAASPRTPLSSRPESVDGDTKDQQLDLNRSSFQWTPVALSIRSEIAALSGAAEESITEDLALLQLGLDSIDLVKLSARLKHAGHELTLSQLMRSQTIAAMSELLGHDRHPENELGHESNYMILKDKLKKAVESVGVDLSNVEAILPTTPLQESMVADMLRSDFDQYFNHDVLELSDGVDFGRYESAWQRVVTASPILRTVFVQIEDPTLEQTYAQVVLRQSNLSINQLYAGDVSGTRDVIIKHQEAARNAHGLSNLLQLSLIVGEGKTLLILSISHALYDGWSLALLHQDVSAAYHSKLVSRPSVEPFLRHLVKTPTGRSRSFWAQYLANVQPSLLEETRSTSSSREKTHRTEAVSSASPAEVTDFCKRHAVSLQVLGQACWAAVLSTLLKTLEVTFGVVLAGRDSEEAQHLMFPTMNTVAVRCFLHGSATDFLQYLQETMGDIVEFQNYPLRKAQAMSGGRLFNTLFILQKSPESRPDNLLATSVDGSAATEFAICAELESTQNNLVWRIAAQNGFVSDKETYELLHQLDRALRYFISSPSDNLLHFEGRDVSICQLPPFEAVRWDEPSQSSSVEAAETDRDNQWTNVEAAIRRVLSQTAAVDPGSIKKSHTLYSLGLDSISAIKVSALLRKEGVSLGVRALLMSSSIPEMAHHAQAGAAVAAVKGPTATSSSFSCDLPETIDKAAILRKAGLVTSQVEGMLPPLPMQVYMITVWQSAEGGVFYPDFFYRLKGPVSRSQLESAWAALVDSEPILRTILVSTGEESLPFVQAVLQPGEDGPHRRLVMGDAGPEQPERASPQVQLRARPTDANSWLLQLSLQHSLYDGFSLPAIMSGLLAILGSKCAPKPTPLDSWRSFLAEASATTTQERNKNFWTEYLAGLSPHTWPQTLSTVTDSSRLARVSPLKSPAVASVGHIQTACSEAGVGLPALFFAAVAKALQTTRMSNTSASTGQVVFGIYYANRSLSADLESTFPTLNLIPLRVRVEEGDSVISMARRVQQDLHLISSYSTVGLWELRRWTGVELDCFVNFLHLGDASGETLATSSLHLESISSGAEIEEAKEAFASAVKPAFCSPRWLEDNAVRGTFSNALDIEASVNGRGLDIGVFGSASRISQDDAEKLIDQLGASLLAV